MLDAKRFEECFIITFKERSESKQKFYQLPQTITLTCPSVNKKQVKIMPKDSENGQGKEYHST